MAASDQDPILTIHLDARKDLWKMFDLDKPGAMDQSIDILDAWIKQQDHFVKKDFNRGYLERTIIKAKGSIERAKKLMDNMCTARTLLPKIFVPSNIKEFEINSVVKTVILPKPTKDHNRVIFLQNRGQQFSADGMIQYYIQMCHYMEYIMNYDYMSSVIFVCDYREANIMEMVKVIDWHEYDQVLQIFYKSYGLRTHSVHFITKSKALNMFVPMIKKFSPAKIRDRFYVHPEIDSFYDHVDKEIMPKDYGGDELSVSELLDKWMDVLSSDSFMDYMKEMAEAKTDETLRKSDGTTNELLGIAGTFRTLNVD